jgi:hypothetical protein
MRDINVGRRLDINELLRREAKVVWAKIGVVVCGPAAMCDDLRALVAQIGKETIRSCAFELEVDVFSWWRMCKGFDENAIYKKICYVFAYSILLVLIIIQHLYLWLIL